MKNFKNILAGIILIGVMASSTFAAGGILVSDVRNDTPTCDQGPSKEKVDSGIVVAGFTGIVVAGFTGIVVAGFTGIVVAGATDTTPTNCGIVVAG